MSIRLNELAELVGGSLTGNGQLMISGAAILSEAGPGQITFADGPSLLDQLIRSTAAAVVVPETFSPPDKSYITVDNTHRAFARIVRRFRPEQAAARRGVSPAAYVADSAVLDDDVDIYPTAFVDENVRIGRGSSIHAGVRILGGCQIGEDVTIYPGAVLYEHTIVGDRTIIHANAVLGAHGFGYELVGGRHQLSSQLGNVEVADDVEIGAGSTVDRGTYGPTRIGEGTKLDNLVMIGHNCRIGRYNLLCAQVGIAGSTDTGDYVVMGGQVGVRDHVQLGDGVMVGAQSGVSESISEAGRYLGTPARPVRKEIQILCAQQKLPTMRKQLARLEKQVGPRRDQIESNSREPKA